MKIGCALECVLLALLKVIDFFVQVSSKGSFRGIHGHIGCSSDGSEPCGITGFFQGLEARRLAGGVPKPLAFTASQR